MKITRRQLKKIIKENLELAEAVDGRWPTDNTFISEVAPAVIAGIGIAAAGVAALGGWHVRSSDPKGQAKVLLDATEEYNPAAQAKKYKKDIDKANLKMGLGSAQKVELATDLHDAVDIIDTSEGTTDEEKIKETLLACGSQFAIAQVAMYYKEAYDETLYERLLDELDENDFRDYVINPINSLKDNFITIGQISGDKTQSFSGPEFNVWLQVVAKGKQGSKEIDQRKAAARKALEKKTADLPASE